MKPVFAFRETFCLWISLGLLTRLASFAAGPPAVTTQPQSQTVLAGASATFTVVATGTVPLSYQWRKDGKNISGGIKGS